MRKERDYGQSPEYSLYCSRDYFSRHQFYLYTAERYVTIFTDVQNEKSGVTRALTSCQCQDAKGRSMAKRWICAFIAAGMMLAVTGCRDSDTSRPKFPLDEEAITAALIEAGLPGIISESETKAEATYKTDYTVRDPNGRDRPLILISSSLSNRARLLQILYIEPIVVEKPEFEWADWKQQLVFAALLSGGFSDSEELYRSFSAQEPPDEVYSAEEKRAYMLAESFTWYAELQGGYCIVHYSLNNARVEYSTFDTKVSEYSPMLSISVYESKDHYESIQERAQERRNAIADENTQQG